MTTGIEWTDATWNPVVGCTPVSAGCLNCYAATMARRLEGMGKAGYEPRRYDQAGRDLTTTPGLQSETDRTVRIAEVRGGRAVFTGEVRCLPERLVEPLKWRQPRRVFVNSMSDLFHEAVPFDFVDRIFAVMALCPRHTFQILTKRPERMAEYLATRTDQVSRAVLELFVKLVNRPGRLAEVLGRNFTSRGLAWRLANVWLGTSVENQEAADERIPHLLRCPGRVRFLSCEPLLSPVDLSAFMGGPYVGLPGDVVHDRYNFGIGWVIAGGESGPRSRPCLTGWLRDLRDQCGDAGVPFFLKQLGSDPKPLQMEGTTWGEIAETTWKLKDPKGGDPAEWPEDLRVREMPGGGA